MDEPVTTLLVVDTETGGLDEQHACIIELAAVVLQVFGDRECRQLAQFNERIRPDRPVDFQAARVNGYTPEEWNKGCLKPDHALFEFFEFVSSGHNQGEMMWTGCNPSFDLRFYYNDCKRHGAAIVQRLDHVSHRVMDVQSLALPLLIAGQVDGLSLRSLRKWAGLEGEQSHSALQDVLDTCGVIAKLLVRRQ